METRYDIIITKGINSGKLDIAIKKILRKCTIPKEQKAQMGSNDSKKAKRNQTEYPTLIDSTSVATY